MTDNLVGGFTHLRSETGNKMTYSKCNSNSTIYGKTENKRHLIRFLAANTNAIFTYNKTTEVQFLTAPQILRGFRLIVTSCLYGRFYGAGRRRKANKET